MSVDQARPFVAGNLDPVPPKRCVCGREGEWPGRLCPDCRSQEIVIRDEPRTTVLVQPTADPSARLDELAAIANGAHTRVHLAGRDLIEHAIRAGAALVEARKLVGEGKWIAWATKHVQVEITTAYRYMRLAEYRKEVLASDARSIEGAIQLLADKPRRGQGPRRYSDADKADWIKLADQIGVKPAARAVGISPSTMHKWTSPNSPSRGKTRLSREVTQERIERLAEWLVGRFGGYDYPERVTPEVRVDAAAALVAALDVEPEPDADATSSASSRLDGARAPAPGPVTPPRPGAPQPSAPPSQAP